ncbi:hypothetical protein ACFQFC_10525 [Amorphoplanes digitatis]|uniref:Uncharacterized protein n=1 Tax=Actinoplanes digitatis TaxID=1868 RepID=A0A7W7MSD0_9ACTN|nr:hypothetical protein [Actinoplanes digitatis]MBB4764632.1 hypothetical protein [Actinoplanes digitatis]
MCSQLGAAWAVGALVVPVMSRVMLIAAFGGGSGAFWAVGFFGALAVVIGLLAVVSATRDVTFLGATGGGRVLWAVLVTGLGTAGWALGWSATDTVGLQVGRWPLWASVLGGIPYALVAGLLLRGLRRSGTALGLTVAILLAGAVALHRQWPQEFEQRLALAGVQRETSYAVTIPGYLPTDHDYGRGLGGGGFRPADPDATPPDLYITIVARRVLRQDGGMCGQPTALDARLDWGLCTSEPGGLIYRHNEIEHGYQVTVGRLYVTIAGNAAVDHASLRAAALSLHPATAAELGGGRDQDGEYFAARIPGYVGQVMGIPPGMQYQPAEPADRGASSVAITLAVSNGDERSACVNAAQCRPEGPDLYYVRREDQHGYAIRHGDETVEVLGGLRVDAATLRQAARDARRTTDEELDRVLPQLPPQSFADRIRIWLRDRF